jgi:AcrR family transcriptional regulator
MNAERAPAPRSYGRRADAERNREKILDHSTRLLMDDPAVGMAEIASASGVGRPTLYRHFATREELIGAIARRAAAETEQAIAISRLEEDTAADALRRLVVAMLEVRDRYPFLITQGSLLPPPGWDEEQERRISAPLIGLFERGQRIGEFSCSLSPAWMVTVFGAVVLSAIHGVNDGLLDEDQAADVVAATLLGGLTASRPASAGS